MKKRSFLEFYELIREQNPPGTPNPTAPKPPAGPGTPGGAPGTTGGAPGGTGGAPGGTGTGGTGGPPGGGTGGTGGPPGAAGGAQGQGTAPPIPDIKEVQPIIDKLAAIPELNKALTDLANAAKAKGLNITVKPAAPAAPGGAPGTPPGKTA